jgi:RNA polymerase sigma factor (sigma-70 family)
MITAISQIELNNNSQKLVQELYELYAEKLQAYARRNYHVSEDVALELVYKTIYRIAEVKERYSFDNEHKRAAFVFKTFINLLRNHYRDDKTFEGRNMEVALNDVESPEEQTASDVNPKLRMLQTALDEMEDWERILLLMRGQGIPYKDISKFVSVPEKQLKVYYSRLKARLLKEMNIKLNK